MKLEIHIWRHSHSKENQIMAGIQELNDKLDSLSSNLQDVKNGLSDVSAAVADAATAQQVTSSKVDTVESGVEQLFELVKNGGVDIKPEVADALLAKLETLSSDVDDLKSSTGAVTSSINTVRDSFAGIDTKLDEVLDDDSTRTS